ncbi:MAG: hypothetical protein Q7T61_15015 [Caulobacter sp.]|nr:hypothetical protein [Caulobacter sp.]
MTRGAPREGGFILAEALVSLGLAALTGALALTLLVWAARTIDRAQARIAAATVIERLYEEARLATPADLRAMTSGKTGRYSWRRLPRGPVEAAAPAGAQRVRLEATWTAGGRPDRSVIDAVVVGGSQ